MKSRPKSLRSAEQIVNDSGLYFGVICRVHLSGSAVEVSPCDRPGGSAGSTSTAEMGRGPQ